MCGRAKLPDDVSEIKIDLKIDVDEIGQYQPRWNAAPTTKLPVVVVDKAQRILTLMRWGLVPSSTFNATIKSFAIITTNANNLLAPLHDRMPVVIAPDRWAEWLGERPAPQDALKDLLRPYPDGAMAFWPVDRRVGNVRNDDPDLFTALSMGDRALSRGLAAPLSK